MLPGILLVLLLLAYIVVSLVLFLAILGSER